MAFNPHFQPAVVSQVTVTDLDRLQKLKNEIVSGLHPIYCVPDDEDLPPPPKKEKPAPVAPVVAPAPLDYERPSQYDKRSASASATPAPSTDPVVSKKRRSRRGNGNKRSVEPSLSEPAEPPPPTYSHQLEETVPIPATEMAGPSKASAMRVSGSLAFDLAESGDEGMHEASADPAGTAPDRHAVDGQSMPLDEEGLPGQASTLAAGLRASTIDADMEDNDARKVFQRESTEADENEAHGQPAREESRGSGDNGHNNGSSAMAASTSRAGTTDAPITSADAQRELETFAGNAAARRRGGKKNRQKNATRNARQNSPGRSRNQAEHREPPPPREVYAEHNGLSSTAHGYDDRDRMPPTRVYDDRGPPPPFYDRGPPGPLLPPPASWRDEPYPPPGPYYDRPPAPYYARGYPEPYPDHPGFRPDLVYERAPRPLPPDNYPPHFYPGEPRFYDGPARPMAAPYEREGRRGRY